MRIVYLSFPSFFDCDISLIKELQIKGHEVFWFVSISPYSLNSTCVSIKKQVPSLGILNSDSYPEFSRFQSFIDLSKLFIVNDNCGKICRKTIGLYRELNRRISVINPDIVHFVGNPDFLNIGTFVRFPNKMVVTVHDPLPHSSEKRFRSEFFRIFLFRFPSRFILLNDSMTDSFCHRYGIQKRRISLSRLGKYDVIKLFESASDYVSYEKKFILFFGRISLYKGLDYLLSSMAEVHRTHPDVNLLIAGKGAGISLPRDVDYIKIRNEYIANEELVGLIKNSIFVVCPYTDATQSGVICTVLALGTPLLVTDVGTMGDVVRAFDAGIVVQPRNTDELTAAMSLMIDNPQMLTEFRKSIHNFSDENAYSWQNIASEYESAYQTLL